MYPYNQGEDVGLDMSYYDELKQGDKVIISGRKLYASTVETVGKFTVNAGGYCFRKRDGTIFQGRPHWGDTRLLSPDDGEEWTLSVEQVNRDSYYEQFRKTDPELLTTETLKSVILLIKKDREERKGKKEKGQKNDGKHKEDERTERV